MSAARASDRQRATLRRDHKHGETPADFEARMLKRAREAAGDRFTVTLTRGQPRGQQDRSYIVSAYGPTDAAAAIRIERANLSASVTAFEHATSKLTAGFCGLPPTQRKAKRKN